MNGQRLFLCWIVNLCLWSTAEERRIDRSVFQVPPATYAIIHSANDYLPMLTLTSQDGTRRYYSFDTEETETDYPLEAVAGSFLLLSVATREEKCFLLCVFQWSIESDSCHGLEVYYQTPDGNVVSEVPGFSLRVSDLNEEQDTFDIEQEMNPTDLPDHLIGTKGLLYIPSFCNLTVDSIILSQPIDSLSQERLIPFLQV